MSPTTVPQLAERIETLRTTEKDHYDSLKLELKGLRSDFDQKFARVYALGGAILVSIITGIVVALVTR